MAACLSSCADELDQVNPNEQTTSSYGNTVDELEETVYVLYHNARMEGSYARVGYTIDVTAGDEVWNSSQVWYLPFDNFTDPITDEINFWPWREWYYCINVANFILYKVGDEDNSTLSTAMQRIKGQALFFRALSYYNLATYYRNPPLILDYESYSTLDGLYASNSDYDEVLDQVEADFYEAIELLPSKEEGGEWALGRATNAAASGYYARTLMLRHKFDEALVELRKIINGDYGTYSLVSNYGDNFREGTAYENNEESIFEIQCLDYGSQGSDQEWTPVNVSSNSTQAHAIESNYCPAVYGGWADLSASPWLYHLFKAERTTDDNLDPRLYWTIGTYEAEWANFENGNVGYCTLMTAENDTVRTNATNGGIPIAKYTNMRTNLYSTVSTGLTCGINIRLMRYSDILLRAAECSNEISGPTQEAIDWINQVRNRANLDGLQLSDFAGDADKLFEQIANVERPKEFGCEYGRLQDLIRWGFFYSSDRLQQMKEHSVYCIDVKLFGIKDEVTYDDIALNGGKVISSFDYYTPGHEYLPIYQSTLDENPNLVGNVNNNNEDLTSDFLGRGWTIRPVVDLDD